jgi:hypothetical protein
MTAIPKTMKAMVLTGHGGLDKYEWHEDWPVPAAAPRRCADQGGCVWPQQH